MAAVGVVLGSPTPMAGLVSVELSSSSVLGGLPPQAAAWRGSLPRPALRLHRELHVHRYLPDGRPWTYQVVGMPDRVCDAGSLCSPPRHARAVFADLVQAMAYTGLLPNEALEQVEGAVLSYVWNVAAWAVQSAAVAPLPTHVSAAVHVHVTEGVVVLNYGGAHLPSLLLQQTTPPVRMTEETQRAMVGQLVGGGRATGTERQQHQEEEEDNEEEGDRCAICLEGFASGGGDRRWLPCSHGFHGECVERWLLRKAECPLCRTNIAA